MTKEVPRTSVLRDAELSISDATLIARLRERAAAEREIQANNEAVATALIGQRLLFEQGLRSASNSFAVRLGLEHENCAKNDAKLANDWDTAANRIEALIAERDAAKAKLAKAVEALEYYAVEAMPWDADDSLIARTTLANIKGESHE